jgi:hypothetical protein
MVLRVYLKLILFMAGVIRDADNLREKCLVL